MLIALLACTGAETPEDTAVEEPPVLEWVVEDLRCDGDEWVRWTVPAEPFVSFQYVLTWTNQGNGQIEWFEDWTSQIETSFPPREEIQLPCENVANYTTTATVTYALRPE